MALLSRAVPLGALVLLALTVPAAAGPPGTWTQVTQPPEDGSSTDRIDLARSGNGVLNVLWSRGNDVVNTQLSADARSVTGTHRLFSYSKGAGKVALLPVADGSLRAFFTGLAPGDPLDQGLATATSADGVTWAVQPTLASDDRPGQKANVYATSLGVTSFTNGTPLSVWSDPGPAAYHVGTSDQTPDVGFGEPKSADVAAPNAATDAATGAVAVGWNDLDTGRTSVLFVQQTLDPWFPPGPTLTAPGGAAADPVVQVGMTGRSGSNPGIFVAYLLGDNVFTSRPVLWRIGARTPISLSSRKGARFPGVTAGQNGRLWAFWAEEPASDRWQVHARRSNPAGTAFGRPVVVNAPTGAESMWGLQGVGSPGGGCDALDVVAHVTRSGSAANHHQRLLPGITLKKKLLNKRRGRRAKVRFTATDAGAPTNVRIKFGAKRKATGEDGRVTMRVKRKRRARRVKATATRACFTKATVRVKVRPQERR